MVRILLSWSDPHDRLFDITLRFTAPADDPLLLLPVWRPGRYLLQNYAANVREWSAGEHAIRKEGKSSWRVSARAGEEVSVTYRYYAGVLDAGSSFLDDDEAYFNGTNLFMLVEGMRHEEHLLTVAAPADWLLECQLKREGEGEAFELRARDYDHLLDSPVIAAARMTRHSFREAGATVHLVFRGDEEIDTARFVEPVRRIVRTQAAIFGGLPFEQYRFLTHLRDRWHGVEHEDSCSIVAQRAALAAAQPGEEAWDHFLSIVSHELFHVWNVKRIVPARFTPYDYWNETPTRLLWVMEGTTSYYGDLTLVRSGIWSTEHYLAHLARVIEVVEGNAARSHLSLAQASFDGWLADPATMHDHPNAWYSFYAKGELVSLMLDLAIRRASGGTRCLDDVMRLLWDQYGRTSAGLEEDGFERAVAAVADVGDFFALYVDGVEPLPYLESFAAAGISFASTVAEPETSSLGARLKVQEGRLLAEAPIRGGAGMAAGLLPGDEIVALDGARVTSEASLKESLKTLAAGETAALLVARAGRLHELRFTGRPDPRPKIALRLDQRAALPVSWLGGNE